MTAPHPMLREALLDCAAGSLTGALRLTGEPGGVIYFAHGAVTAIDTPGAPGPEVILLRSGRVAEAAWAAAFAAGAASGRMGAELHSRGLVGSGELEALLRVVLADGMFVLASGEVEAYEVEEAPAGHLLPLSPAADPQWLLSEAARRMTMLKALPTPIEHDRDRMTPVPRLLPPGGTAGAAEDRILALANGRRTARDMAFVLGRGVFAVTLQLARLHEAGLVVIDSRRPGRVRPAELARPAGPAGPAGRRPGSGGGPGRRVRAAGSGWRGPGWCGPGCRGSGRGGRPREPAAPAAPGRFPGRGQAGGGQAGGGPSRREPNRPGPRRRGPNRRASRTSPRCSGCSARGPPRAIAGRVTTRPRSRHGRGISD